MRKSINGLTALVVEVLKQNSQSRYLFLFRNQANNKVKGLYWDKNGFALIYKRLEQSKFGFPMAELHAKLKMVTASLLWLKTHKIQVMQNKSLLDEMQLRIAEYRMIKQNIKDKLPIMQSCQNDFRIIDLFTPIF